MSASVKVKGVSIDFAGGALVVPPLSLASVESLQESLSTYTGTLKDVTVVINALHHSLKRNYPDMSRDEVAELVDMGNMQEVMLAVMNVSGLVKKAGETGEAKAAS